jgi:hypothetical protein
VLHWLGWSGEVPVVERIGRHGCVECPLSLWSEVDPDPPPRSFYSRLDNLYLRSVTALEWIIAELEYRPRVINEPPIRPDPAAAPPGGDGTDATDPDKPPNQPKKMTPKRLKPGEAAFKIVAALDALAADGKWNVAEAEIWMRAGVSRSTYYSVKDRDDTVKDAMERYHDRRLGRGPARPGDF